MRILFALLAIGVVVVALVAAPDIAERIEIGNRYARERNLIELERQRDQLARQQQWQSLTLPANVAMQYAAYALLIVAGALFLRYANDGRGRKVRDHELIQVAGLPVPRRVLEAGDPELLELMADALRADKFRAIEEARRQLPPHTYAPKISYGGAALPDNAAQEAVQALPVAPALSELVMNGWRPTAQRMLLGYSGNGPIYGNVGALLSTAIAGRPNQGKSTLLRLVYWQLATVGGTVAILDPHGSILDSVAGAPVEYTASTGGELSDLGAVLIDELDRRLTLYRAGKRDFKPYLALCDEFPVISLSSKDAVAAAGKLVLEGRKVAMYCLISGQGLPAEQFGGRLVRDALSSRYVFKTTRDEARRAGLMGESARMVEGLHPGVCVLDGPTSEPTIVAVPNCTSDDITTLVQGVVQGRERAGLSEPVLNQSLNQGGFSQHNATNPRVERVRQMLKEKATFNEILGDVWSVKGKGPKWQDASEELRAILAIIAGS
jgi:hypothetical protein